jgi:hypothetical protein
MKTLLTYGKSYLSYKECRSLLVSVANKRQDPCTSRGFVFLVHLLVSFIFSILNI